MGIKTWIALGAVAVGAVLFVPVAISSYNDNLQRDQVVQTASSDLSALYQRRSDLIPSLVAIVQAAGYQERDTLREVMEARASATKVTIDPSKATPEQLAKFQEAQGVLAVALGKLMMVQERYPELKTNQNYVTLMSQVEGTENRISVQRQRYNKTTGDFNVHIRTFPNNLVNTFVGRFNAYPMFKEQAGAENAPQINFKR